jgi:hypothetical protein
LGTLSSIDPDCSASQTVELRLRGVSGSVDGTITSSTGRYTFPKKLHRDAVVRVLFQGTASCPATRSDAREIKVT